MQQYLPPANLENIVGNPPAQGYGLIDTMGDVIVSTVAAAVVCVIGYITLKKKKPAFSRFLFRKITDYDTAIKEATEAGDEKLVVALEKAKAKFEKKHADCETEEEEKDPEQNSGGVLIDNNSTGSMYGIGLLVNSLAMTRRLTCHCEEGVARRGNPLHGTRAV